MRSKRVLWFKEKEEEERKRGREREGARGSKRERD